MTIYSNAFSNSGLKKLTIPDCYPFYIQGYAFDGSQLTEVISYIEWPEALDADAFTGIPAEATLSVPYESQYQYEYQTGWDHFFGHIEERPYVPTGVESINHQPSAVQIYDQQGIRQNELKKGLNIVRQADGTTRKVVMK